MTVYEIIELLRSNNSGNFKFDVMQEHANNEELKEFFRLCLDKQLNFYIRKIPKYDTKHLGDISLSDAMRSLSKLSSRMFTGKKATIFLSKLLNTNCAIRRSTSGQANGRSYSAASTLPCPSAFGRGRYRSG